jgi:serine/threonine-protein kinase
MKEDGPLKIGSRFLKYEVKALLGRGGHAWVYHGFDAFMGRNVAIKIVHRSGGVTRDMLRRGQAEAQFLSRLKHPNIVEVIDAGMTDEGLLYIVMELLQGRSLYDIIREEKKLEMQEALTVFAAIADALQAAHDAGAIHRDLKPGNVFVVKDNRPKVLDFGIAKIVDAAWTTQQDIVLGTVFYMSPEQLQARNLTRHTDIYSLGAMLYEVLSGVHYIRRAAAAKGATLQNIYSVIPFVVHEDVTPLHELDRSIPAHTGRVVDRCMAKSPDQRFDSMKEVAAALRHSLARFLDEAQAAGRPSYCRDLSRPSLPGVHASEARLPLPEQREASVAAPPTAAGTATEAFTHSPFFGAASVVHSARPGEVPLHVQLITEPVSPLQPGPAAYAPPTNAPPSTLANPARSSRLKETLPLGSGEGPIRGVAPAHARPSSSLPTGPSGVNAWSERAITPSSVSAVASHVSAAPADTGSKGPASGGSLKRALIVAGVAGPLLFGGGTFLVLTLVKKPNQEALAAPSAVVVESVMSPAPALIPPPPPPVETVTAPASSAEPEAPPAEPSASRKVAGPKTAPAPRPLSPTTKPGSSARPTTKDKMDERLEMLEEDFKKQGSKKSSP